MKFGFSVRGAGSARPWGPGRMRAVRAGTLGPVEAAGDVLAADCGWSQSGKGRAGGSGSGPGMLPGVGLVRWLDPC